MKKTIVALGAVLLTTSLLVAQEPQKTEKKVVKKEHEVKEK
jgi:hypothetical protein